MTLDEQFNQLVKNAEINDEISAMFLVGSRGKGFENEHSDYDAIVNTKDDALEKVKTELESGKNPEIDLNIQSLSGFKDYALHDSPEGWDRYSFAHVKILFDKTGELQEVIHQKGIISSDKQKQFVEWWIDGYVNGVFRSVKCIRNKNQFGAHLEAVNSMLDLLTLVFALNGRIRPFLGYTEKELLMYPLQKIPFETKELIAKITTVLQSADLATQQELLKGVEKLCRAEGFGYMFDGWEGKDKWAMEYTLKSE